MIVPTSGWPILNPVDGEVFQEGAFGLTFER